MPERTTDPDADPAHSLDVPYGTSSHLSERDMLNLSVEIGRALPYSATHVTGTLLHDKAPLVATLDKIIGRHVTAAVQRALEPYVDEGGLPRHLPMGLTADGQGPTEPDPPHHRGCWCNDPLCIWTVALADERRDAAAHRSPR